MKKLLSYKLTKQDLTEFLGNHLEQHFTLMERRYFIVIKIRGFRVFWPNPQISTKFNPAKNRYGRNREDKSPQKFWKRRLIREIFKFIIK